MKNIMTHVVAGYPSEKECIELMLGMQKAGVEIIEVQIPFSDPIADGETIMRANDTALLNVDIAGSFELIKKARKRGLSAEIYIMSYAQKVFHYGAPDFCRTAKSAGVMGLIVPDLPFDSPEYGELARETGKNSLQIVPVVSPGMDSTRLKQALANKSSLVYLTSRKGITGNQLAVSTDLKKLCQDVQKISPEAKIAVGFGISSRRDVSEISKIADIAVVGSSIIRAVEKSGVAEALKFIGSLRQV